MGILADIQKAITGSMIRMWWFSVSAELAALQQAHGELVRSFDAATFKLTDQHLEVIEAQVARDALSVANQELRVALESVRQTIAQQQARLTQFAGASSEGAASRLEEGP